MCLISLGSSGRSNQWEVDREKEMPSSNWHSSTNNGSTSHERWSSQTSRTNIGSSSNHHSGNSGQSNFLASAANIMMGVGMMGNSRSSQEQRYDAYKSMGTSGDRRY